ncbi:MAG: ECF transporter S component [Lachnospiraceae bacterium]|nr:ECF transporter S component [Lachnospiraceae bacterium]
MNEDTVKLTTDSSPAVQPKDRLDDFLDRFLDNKPGSGERTEEEDNRIRIFENTGIIGAGSADAAYILNVPHPSKQSLTKRTLTAFLPTLIGVPLIIFIGIRFLGDRQYLAISLGVILLSILPFFLRFEGRRPMTRELVILAVLTAIAVMARAVFFMFPSFKCMAAIAIVAGISFGAESGFLVGALSMLVSNMLFGQGPWTPWQMLAMGMIGFLAGIIFNIGLLKVRIPVMCVFGFIVTVVVYGGILNPASLFMQSAAITKESLAAIYLSGLPVDLVHATSTTLFLAVGAEPMLEKLGRIKRKYGMMHAE